MARCACFCGAEFNFTMWSSAMCPNCHTPVDPFEPDAAEPERLVTPIQADELLAHFEAS